jgi:hypothetical protein
MIDWQRKRAPEDVPTPVAVAVSDFCRRARAAASPAMVRDALSCVDESFDARLRALADTEPSASPLGPFAVVDVVSGTDQPEAAQRERDGRYAEIRQTLRAVASPVLEPSKPVLVAVTPEAAPEPQAESNRPKSASHGKRSKAEQLKERIRPRRRDPQVEEKPAETAEPQVFGTSFLPRRNLPAPRGRFTRIDPQRASYEVLLRPESSELVESLVAQVPHRFALWKTLDQGYTGRRGHALTIDEVVALLERHHQARTLCVRERESVLAGVTDARGSLVKASQDLALRDRELERLITELRLEREVEELRERFRRDALDSKNLGWRLELVGRPKYLTDLGIEAKFELALARDLQRLLGDEPSAQARWALAERIGKREALDPHLLERAFEHLGLP